MGCENDCLEIFSESAHSRDLHRHLDIVCFSRWFAAGRMAAVTRGIGRLIWSLSKQKKLANLNAGCVRFMGQHARTFAGSFKDAEQAKRFLQNLDEGSKNLLKKEINESDKREVIQHLMDEYDEITHFQEGRVNIYLFLC